jgi:hypothetical protein
MTDDSRFKRLMDGEQDLRPVGFPGEAVFRYDPELAAKITDLCNDAKWDWNKLTPFSRFGIIGSP